MLTPYHAKYYAYELTRRAASDDPEKLGASLFNAVVDLNPHQVDAALFAFKSPLSRGAILADEVGLGKTIEAGLILCQLWAEKRRRILVICPTMIRKQWAQELQDKFSIDAVVLDRKAYNAAKKKGDNPFEPGDQVVVCSYHFAAGQQLDVFKVFWDLVIIDEAHRLRNVWKNQTGIAARIKDAVENRPLVMLTATPLQNSLLELYGLVSFIDPHMFGDVDAFRARYMRGTPEERDFQDLRARLKPICQRTLRRHVQEYVPFTNRHSLTQAFEPYEDEQQLYTLVSTYLQREELAAVPYRQRSLLTLVLRKILASSSFAIANTLDTLINRIAVEHGDALEKLEEDYETASEEAEEWTDDDTEREAPRALPPDMVKREIEELTAYLELAQSISRNAKGEALLTALQKGFDKMRDLKANQKAVIFTESKRTQKYLVDLLSANGYKGNIVTLSGSGNDPIVNEIYRDWLARHKGSPAVTGSKAVDSRSALVEEFRDRRDILIATEAGAEGVNLQFCSLVVNYDLPWNPQRIEQRIGRCHRYGQTHDVVVVNFLNELNAADKRVYELLDKKLKLFEGVFGASDEILGALESGVDFERRILNIYQQCRTNDQIDAAFAELQKDLDQEISARYKEAQRNLFEHFDEDVRERIKLTGKHAGERLDSLGKMLWGLTKATLGDDVMFDDDHYQFVLPPQMTQALPIGPYELARPGKETRDAIRYSLATPLSQRLIEDAKSRALEPARITFTYGAEKAGILEPYLGKSGWLSLSRLEVSSAKDQEERLIFAVLDDSGQPLDPDFGAKLLRQEAFTTEPVSVPSDVEAALGERTQYLTNVELAKVADRNRDFFEQELDKLERWSDDLKHGLEVEIRDLDKAIRQLGKDVRLAPTLEAKLTMAREKANAESARNRKRRELFEAQDKIDCHKTELIEEIETRLRQSSSITSLMLVQWKLWNHV